MTSENSYILTTVAYLQFVNDSCGGQVVQHDESRLRSGLQGLRSRHSAPFQAEVMDESRLQSGLQGLRSCHSAPVQAEVMDKSRLQSGLQGLRSRHSAPVQAEVTELIAKIIMRKVSERPQNFG